MHEVDAYKVILKEPGLAILGNFSTDQIVIELRPSLREDQAEVTHAISPFSMKLCQVEGTTQYL